MKVSLSVTCRHSRMCIRIYIFNFKTKTKKESKKTKKAKETKKEKRISEENITGYHDVVCEFNEVYVQQDKSQYEVHTFKNKNKIKSLRDIFVYHFLFYICLFVAATLL